MFVGHLYIFSGEMPIHFLLSLLVSSDCHHKTDCIANQTNVFSYNAGAWKCDIKLPTWSIRFSSWLIGRLHTVLCLLTLYQMHILQIFSTILQVAFSTLFSVLCCTEVLRLILFFYFYFVTITCALGTISKKSLLIQHREALHLFSSKSYQVLHLGL